MNRHPDSTDLTDAQWERLRAVFPAAKNGRTGRPRTYPLREIDNALLYQARTGCARRGDGLSVPEGRARNSLSREPFIRGVRVHPLGPPTRAYSAGPYTCA